MQHNLPLSLAAALPQNLSLIFSAPSQHLLCRNPWDIGSPAEDSTILKVLSLGDGVVGWAPYFLEGVGLGGGRYHLTPCAPYYHHWAGRNAHHAMKSEVNEVCTRPKCAPLILSYQVWGSRQIFWGLQHSTCPQHPNWQRVDCP